MHHIPCDFVQRSELRIADEGDTLTISCVTDHIVRDNVISASHLLCMFFCISRLCGYTVERQLTANNTILIEIFMKLYIRFQESQMDNYSMGDIWLYSSVHPPMNPSSQPH